MQNPWSCRLSKCESLPSGAFLFDHWVVEEFRRLDGFTALVVLVGIGDTTVSPLRSTFMHVIGEELDWMEFCKLLAGAGVAWDGVLLETVSAKDGGPVTDAEARAALRALEKRVVEDRLVINEGHFFDKWGRRLKIEEALPQ
ncbi:MAG: hypothetical protein RO009_10100 [Pseudorhodoplanes sp.]|jgi:hypothetical protein|nr:hypothetical protein [Pseudorhodoplanes sp.]